MSKRATILLILTLFLFINLFSVTALTTCTDVETVTEICEDDVCLDYITDIDRTIVCAGGYATVCRTNEVTNEQCTTKITTSPTKTRYTGKYKILSQTDIQYHMEQTDVMVVLGSTVIDGEIITLSRRDKLLYLYTTNLSQTVPVYEEVVNTSPQSLTSHAVEEVVGKKYKRINKTYLVPETIPLRRESLTATPISITRNDTLYKTYNTKGEVIKEEQRHGFYVQVNPQTDLWLKIGENSTIVIQESDFYDNSVQNNATVEANSTHLTISDNDLMLYLPTDLNRTNTVYDYTSHNKDGTLINMTYNPTGKYGSAYTFDGITSYIDLGTAHQDFWLNNVTTIVAWIYKTNTYSSYMFASRDDADGAYSVWIDNVALKGIVGGASQYNTGLNITLNQWEHVVIVFDGTHVKGYLNGVGGTQVPYTITVWDATDSVYIGFRESGAANHYFSGNIDEVMVFNRSLSATEIGQIYSHTYPLFYQNATHALPTFNLSTNTDSVTFNFTGSNQYQNTSIREYLNCWEQSNGYTDNAETGQLLSYHLDNNSVYGENSTHVHDFSGNSRHGEIINTSSTDAGRYGGGLSFDGADTLSIPSLNLGTTATISMWIYPRDLSGYSLMIGQHKINNGWCYIKYADQIACRNSNVYNIVTPGYNFTENEWQHLVFVLNNSVMTTYRNNVKCTICNAFSGAWVMSNFADYYGDEGYNGSMDEIQIYDRAFTSTEVARLYVTGLLDFLPLSPMSLNSKHEVNSTTTHVQPVYLLNTNTNASYSPELLLDQGVASATYDIADFYLTECTVLDRAGSTYTLTADISNSSTSNCIDITANNITLDCNGHTIEGNGIADYGIRIYRTLLTGGHTYITLKDCTLSGWDTASVYLRYAYSNNITNLTINGGGVGIYVRSGHYNRLNNATISNTDDQGIKLFESFDTVLTNVTVQNGADWGMEIQDSKRTSLTNINLTNNSQYDLYFRARNSDFCKLDLTNVLGTGNKPILFYNSTSIIENNSDISLLILCNADDSVINNITITNPKKINALQLIESGSVSIYNTTLSSLYKGCIIEDSDNVNMTDCVVDNGTYGLYMESSTDVIITNSTISNNVYGITPTTDGYMSFFFNSLINSSEYGLGVLSFNQNTVYNNLFNQTRNLYLLDSYRTGIYTITKQAGTRIYSTGPYIGGNYWANSAGTEYSDLCIDHDFDGFCDNAATLYEEPGSQQTDTLPLSSDYDSVPPKWANHSINATPYLNQTVTFSVQLGYSNYYQESANSVTCVGDCGFEGNDTNWASQDDDESNVYEFNYTKPTDSVGLTWQIKDDREGSRNNSLPNSCWDYSSTQAELQFSGSHPQNYGNWNCNNASWETVESTGLGTDIYEEGVWWLYGADIDSYIFSHNMSGTWTNQTLQTVSAQYVNATHDIFVNVSKGTEVCSRIWFNDTNNNINSTNITCFTVKNSLPIISSVTISPSPAISSNNVTFINTTTDYDGDTILNWSIIWYKNGMPQAAFNNVTTINNANVSVDDMWNVSLRAYDGEEWSVAVTSAGLTVNDLDAPVLANDTLSTSSGENNVPFNVYIDVSELNNLADVSVHIYLGATLYVSATMSPGTVQGTQSYLCIPSTDGIYTFNFTARDGSGNEATLESNLTYLESTTNPYISTGGGPSSEPRVIKETVIVTNVSVEEIKGVCGNGLCEPGETPWDCPRDCAVDLLNWENVFCLPLFNCGTWAQAWFINIVIISLGAFLIFVYIRAQRVGKLSQR